ncbi:MAG: SsrA-binding protein SmpB [Leptospiraceae bacterium]|nr:SsrA-binding protein SmpB [Leptospiraceae bacterium]MCB1200914.1 SsrA-binding protein SmpB [Leptospiraceae bacterium]
MEIVVNRKARFQYEILEDFEAGIVLVGSEVKSLREKKVNLTDAYGVFRGDELFLMNCRIDPFSHASHFNHEPARSRKLLLHRRELDRLKGKLQTKGLVIVPLKLYFKKNLVKVLIGLGKGKKLHDKRASLREKDVKREMDREMKNYR